MDIAAAVSDTATTKIIGSDLEKLHEQMIGVEDAPFTFEYDDYYKILPMINDWFNSSDRIKDGVRVEENFSYVSNTNKEWMSVADLRVWLGNNL